MDGSDDECCVLSSDSENDFGDQEIFAENYSLEKKFNDSLSMETDEDYEVFTPEQSE